MIDSEYFERSEFACKCGCGFATVDVELLNVLTKVRMHFDSPVTINSGCRCLEHNEAVQFNANPEYIAYSSRSKHMLGIAADIVVRNVWPADVYDYINSIFKNNYGLGYYDTFTHVDVRPDKSRW